MVLATLAVFVVLDFSYEIMCGDNIDYNQKADRPPLYHHGNPITLTIQEGQLEWPSIEGETVFLIIDINATLLGSIRQPYIELQHADTIIRQYIEPRAKGLRYVNISNFTHNTINPGDTLSIRCQHMTLKSDSVECVSFNNGNTRQEKYLILSPHPDDAEIAAFGLYNDVDATIITITAGESGPAYHSHKDKAARQFHKGKVRAYDSISVPLSTGKVSPDKVACLGYFNGMLNKMHKEPSKNFTSKSAKIESIADFRKSFNKNLLNDNDGLCTWNNLVDDLTHLINTTKPSVIVTAHPQMDSHKDHRLTTKAVMEALTKTAHQPTRFFFYVNHLGKTDAFPTGEAHSTLSIAPYEKTDGTLLGSLYSHPLTNQRQLEKAMAMFLMHDLKDGPWNRISCYEKVKEQFTNWVTAKQPSPYGNNQYFKQAVRSNELFYVVEIKQ